MVQLENVEFYHVFFLMNYGGFRFDCFSLSHSIDALWTAKVFIHSEDRFGVSFGIARKGNECKMDRGEVT